ncbi:hypothetical protein BGX23_009888 [Mortierella sp. AD031]|nr:hypothetical protein BGX23_009888 [Mortierella sp. AD031]KAG0211383.1 hypothetical protein BGX33_004364 [Mortierella sp. NVP41]
MSEPQVVDEQIISSTSEPTVEIIEEVQPDGSIIRKKKTTRKITKRVLTTTAVREEVPQQQQGETREHEHQHQITASASSESESSESTLKGLSVGSVEESTMTGSTTTTTTITSSSSSSSTTTAATANAITSSTSETTEESEDVSEKSAATSTTTTEQEQESNKRTFKYSVFGKGDVSSHPFYKFLARFPLKQSPAPHTRPRPVKPILYAFAPGWKVPEAAEKQDVKETEAKDEKKEKEPIVGSFDVDSLKWMAYLKFNGIEFEIKPAFEPTMSPSGKLPFLALPNGSLVTAEGFEQFVQENKSQDKDRAPAPLGIHEAAEAVAFTTLAESKIHAALLYTLWFEAPHFHGTTRQHYFGHHNYYLGKLLNYLSKSNIVHSMLLTRTQIDRELIFEEAAVALEALSVQLGDNEYFFGNAAPSSLDAVVFSYLHVILTLPRIRNAEDGGRSGELARMVRKHDNLFKYSQNIWKKSFAA